MKVVFKGGCFCGRIRYEARGTPRNVTVCHCADCRRATGSAVVGWMTLRPSELHYVFEMPRTFSSSPGVKRSFCPGCGTSLTYRRERLDEVDVTIASLDDPEAMPPADHVWTVKRLRWVQVADGLPQYEEARPEAGSS